jgi:hypothetical protein
MNTKKTIGIVAIVIAVLVIGGLTGYFIGQYNKDQAINDAKQSATKEATDVAKADALKALTKADSDKTPQEKAPAKVVTDTTCNADELSLTVEAADAAAGTIAYNVVLANSGKRTCTLVGFPGVSLVNDNGNQVGSPAERATNYVEKKLTLAPGVKVKAIASTSDSGNFPDGQCKAGATKLRVYPPNDTGYLSAPTTISAWCPGFMISPVLDM